MSRRRDIAFIAGTLRQGGAERQLFYMIRELLSMGHRVRVFTFVAGELWEEAIQGLGVAVRNTGAASSRWARITTLIRAMKDDPPDVVQSQHFYTNLYAVSTAWALGTKSVGAVRSSGQWEPQALGWVMGTLSVRLPTLLAVNSQSVARTIQGRRAKKESVRYVSNMVDREQFVPRSTPRQPDAVFRILCVGRLVAPKRYDRLVKIIEALETKTEHDYVVDMVGDGALRGELERLVTQASFPSQRVRFRGMVGDVAKEYREADLVLVTSDHEGMPNVVLEAMASGVPVVAADVGGMREVIEQGVSGWTVPRDDIDAYVQRVVSFMEERQLCYSFGQAARRRVEQHYSSEALRERLSALYECLDS